MISAAEKMDTVKADLLPLERKKIEVQVNGTKKNIPALDKYWLLEENHAFSRYAPHPVPDENGRFILGAKETWLDLVKFFQHDVRWLLSLKYHKFWSYMVYCSEARDLLISFLQEAPPYYLRDKFPDDKEMKEALNEAEHLVLLAFLRLSVRKESRNNYVENLGELLYENYIFTVPILLDICVIYGVGNRDLVLKLINNVIEAAPQFLNDFKEIVPHFLNVTQLMRSKFLTEHYDSVTSKLNEKKVLHSSDVKDLVLHFYDSVATIQAFLDIYPQGGKLFCSSEFISEIALFYGNVIPKMYAAVKKHDCDSLRNWNAYEMINNCRLDIIKIIRNILASITNDAMNSTDKRGECIERYLTYMSDLLSESAFISDYNALYPVDMDLDVLTQIYPSVDSVKISYILEAIASCKNLPPALQKKKEPTSHYVNYPHAKEEESASALPTKVSGVELESLITEVKDILPHLGDGFIEECLKHYDYKTEKVIAAVLENTLPPNLEELDWNLDRKSNVKESERLNVFDHDEFDIMTRDHVDTSKIHKGKRKSKYKNLNEMLEDKTEISELRDRYSQLSIINDNDYDDEFDDTYEGLDVTVREADDSERERRPFVVPRVLRTKEMDDESDEEESEEEASQNDNQRDSFVQNPAVLRELREQKRREHVQRDVIGKAKGQGQEKQVLNNRNFKGTHKSSMANHNRKNQASSKRNRGMIPS